jgi:TonB-dependent starch-binding outer membrane protein SusC
MLYLTVCYYNNRTSNQLVAYKLPSATGFNYVAVTNWPAVVRNSGFELSLRINNKRESMAGIDWTCEANLTMPRNKLLSFPGLVNSEYNLRLVEGKSLTVQNGYEYEGVDPLTGYFRFKDKNNDGLIDYSGDFTTLGNLDVKSHGGLLNIVGYKNWQLQVFMEGRQQAGTSFLYAVYNDALPGIAMRNQPAALLNRWQKINDQAVFQKYSTGKDPAAEDARIKLTQSSGRYSNTSFIRLKTVALSYNLSRKWLSRLHIKSGSIYVQGYNLLTISSYKDLDPETQSLNALPPLRTITAGMKVSF